MSDVRQLQMAGIGEENPQWHPYIGWNNQLATPSVSKCMKYHWCRYAEIVNSLDQIDNTLNWMSFMQELMEVV